MNIPVKNCSSCMACANICANSAIKIIQDEEGFYRPQIDENICSQCGMCENICPWTKTVENPNDNSSIPRTFAAYNNNSSIRMSSSSGGIFSALAHVVLKKGGVVVGVGYKDQTHLEFKIIEKEEDLKLILQSKYFQANVGLIYKQVKKILQSNREVLFSGTSCQIAALYAILGKHKFKNLTTVDIVCHGVPSQKVFEKYIQEMESKNKKIISTNFRDKISGWKRYSMTNVFVNQNKLINKESKILRADVFMKAFLDNLCLNTSCGNCKYGKVPRIADISIGDFWGLAKYHPEMDDDKGTSVVLLNNTHGELLYNSCQKDIISSQSCLEYATEGNPCIIHPCHPHKNRDDFMANLKTKPLSKLLKKYSPPPSILYRAINKIKRYTQKIFATVRNTGH